ncbi:MAG: dipeptidase [Pseudomonadota bacterium]
MTDPEVLALHDELLTIDSHIDIGPGFGTERLDPGVLNRAQVNLPSMRIGGLDAGFFIVYTPQAKVTEDAYAKAFQTAEDRYVAILRMLRAYPDQIALASSSEEVESVHAEDKLVALIGIENSFPLGLTAEEIQKNVAIWAARGARYASLTHFGHNQFGGSSNPSAQRGDGEDPGLSELGKVLIAVLNDNGMMVDISHVGPKTAADAIALSRAPVIASHSTVKAVHDNLRGLSDDQLRAIRDSGGVVQVTAFRSYIAKVDPQVSAAARILRGRLGLTSGAAFAAATPETLSEYASEIARIRQTFGDVTLSQFLDHVDHAVKIAGIDHVGVSGDFDGGGGVQGWNGAADSPNVTAGLLDRGYSKEDIAKIWGGNLLRVMREVEAESVVER